MASATFARDAVVVMRDDGKLGLAVNAMPNRQFNKLMTGSPPMKD